MNGAELPRSVRHLLHPAATGGTLVTARDRLPLVGWFGVTGAMRRGRVGTGSVLVEPQDWTRSAQLTGSEYHHPTPQSNHNNVMLHCGRSQ